mmetsp:Transcript_28540/g.45943  ORF Transcript_28540/g.45943 Transcript_28540/m.45943 type:complete len:171 (+) Transcript_28540:37-549(+)
MYSGSSIFDRSRPPGTFEEVVGAQKTKLNPHASEWVPHENGLGLHGLSRIPEIGLPVNPPHCVTNKGGGRLLPEHLLGNWADSLGNAVLVFSTDAYEVRLMATLSQPPRKDITLQLRPVPGGGWICGNAMLDPVWTSKTQLHWLAIDGRISVWVRPNHDGNAGLEEDACM